MGAGDKLLKTNSGLSIELRCSRKLAFHGAGWGAVELEVEAMVRWKVRERWERRASGLEAMVADVVSFREANGVVRSMCDSPGVRSNIFSR